MARKVAEVVPPEWSYCVDEEQAGTDIKDVKILPSEEEKAALCKRLNLLSLDKLEAHLKLHKASGGMVIEVQGELRAELTQACVVSLEPVASSVHESFEAWFADPGKAVSFAKARRNLKSEKGGEMPIVEESDDPEPIIDGKIDLGELVTQYLSLALNPYPHAPGYEPSAQDEGAPGQSISDVRKNPFAALKDWKRKHEAGE